ncbi:hypothetical protein AOLI_G00027530 [Acnodon oligacanthus]
MIRQQFCTDLNYLPRLNTAYCCGCEAPYERIQPSTLSADANTVERSRSGRSEGSVVLLTQVHSLKVRKENTRSSCYM